MDIKNWADFGALTKEELDAFTPEELDNLKTSIADNEAKAAEESKKQAEEFAKAKELAENYKIRAEKAEKAKKVTGEADPPKDHANPLSTKDVIALSKANINDEDIDEVLEYAQFKKISVAEALKSPVVRKTLEEKEELRKSAAVANIKSPRSSSRVTDETLIQQANEGKLPESPTDIEKLAEARMNSRIKNK